MGSTMRSLAMRNATKQNSAPEIENIIYNDTASDDVTTSTAQLVDFDSSMTDELIEQVDATAAADTLAEIFPDPIVESSEPAPVDSASVSQDVIVSADAIDKKKSKPKPPVKKSNKTSSQKKVNPSKVETSS